jgi:2-amino-4-hydroxy-6-hydroxymethyldihydropteridine diphosphokinase
VNRWSPAYIGIGSNLSDPFSQVRQAFAALAALPSTRLVARSRLYRTKPFGPVAQDDFINAAAGLLTQLAPAELLQAIRSIENAQGRQRSERWGPRTLDLDLLVYASQSLASGELTVPHPGIAERAFVLQPLADISPTLDVPGLGSVEHLLSRLPDGGIDVVVS